MKQPISGPAFTRIFVFLLGLLIISGSANKLYIYCGLRFLGNTTYGVIDHPASGRDFGGRPLIQYKDSLGNMYDFKSRAKTSWFHTPIRGERIRIFYDKNNPRKAIVDSLSYHLVLPLIFFITGCYCIYSTFTLHKDDEEAIGLT